MHEGKSIDSVEPENIARHMVRLYKHSLGRDFSLLTFAASVLLSRAEPRRALIVGLNAKWSTCVHNKVPSSKNTPCCWERLFFAFFCVCVAACIHYVMLSAYRCSWRCHCCCIMHIQYYTVRNPELRATWSHTAMVWRGVIVDSGEHFTPHITPWLHYYLSHQSSFK